MTIHDYEHMCNIISAAPATTTPDADNNELDKNVQATTRYFWQQIDSTDSRAPRLAKKATPAKDAPKKPAAEKPKFVTMACTIKRRGVH